MLNTFTNDSRVLKENISLKKAGYDVTVLALYREDLKDIEVIDGVKVKRLHGGGVRKRTFERKVQLVVSPCATCQNNEYIFMKSLSSFLAKALKYIYIKIKLKLIRPIFIIFSVQPFKLFFKFVKEAKEADILHCNDLYTLPMGVAVKFLYNKKVKIIYDAHEYETEVNRLRGIKKIFKKILERFFIGFADKIITVSDSIANEYVRLYSIKKPYLVLNTPHFKGNINKNNIFREKFSIEKEKLIILYQGALGPGRGIEIILQAFGGINNKKIAIVFMGYGNLKNRIIGYAEKNNNIFFHDAVSPENLLDYTCSADFGICTIEDTCLSYRYCLPNKMFEYLMAEIPVIASDLPEMKKIITTYNVGVTLKSNTYEGIKNAVDEAINLNRTEIHRNILRIKKEYNWEEQEKVLLKLYGEL